MRTHFCADTSMVNPTPEKSIVLIEFTNSLLKMADDADRGSQ